MGSTWHAPRSCGRVAAVCGTHEFTPSLGFVLVRAGHVFCAPRDPPAQPASAGIGRAGPRTQLVAAQHHGRLRARSSRSSPSTIAARTVSAAPGKWRGDMGLLLGASRGENLGIYCDLMATSPKSLGWAYTPVLTRAVDSINGSRVKRRLSSCKK